MKILVTGGLGFLGRWLLAESSPADELILLTRQSNISDFNFLGRRAVCLQTDYSTADLTDHFRSADAVVHLAAVRPALGLPSSAYQFNLDSTENLLAACLQAGVSNVVLASSRAVYGKANPCPWTEEQTPQPDSAYGESKLAVEQIANLYFTRFGLPSRSLRLAQLAGWGERPGYALMNFIQSAAEKRPLHVFAGGADGREYLYVRDAARAVLAALQHPTRHGVFNIGSEQPISILALARLINRIFENEGNLEVDPLAAESGPMYWMSSQKARQLLGWNPHWTLEAGLSEIRNLIHP